MERQFTKRTYTSAQASLLTKSMIIASIAFLVLGACSYGWSLLFYQTLDYAANPSMGLAIFLLTLLTGMIVSILWCKNMFQSQSIGLTILCYGLYILTTSLAFGWLFSIALTYMSMVWLPAMFAITAGVFLLTLIIAKLISFRSVLTMGKIIGATAMAMMIFLIVFMVLAIVTSATRSEGVALATDTILSLIMMGMAVVSFLYVIIDIWQISKIDEFVNQTGEQSVGILPWFFGFRLLTDLVNVLFIVFMFVLRYFRRS